MTLPIPSHELTHSHTDGHNTGHGHKAAISPSRSVLAWPAWLRVAAVLPLILLLWLAVWWANMGVKLW
jgi:hypothetical protein